jgi:hypothetical protein
MRTKLIIKGQIITQEKNMIRAVQSESTAWDKDCNLEIAWQI